MSNHPLGPRAYIIFQATAIDRLLTLLIKEPWYVERYTTDPVFKDTMHDAIHALKHLREYADLVGRTPTDAGKGRAL